MTPCWEIVAKHKDYDGLVTTDRTLHGETEVEARATFLALYPNYEITTINEMVGWKNALEPNQA